MGVPRHEPIDAVAFTRAGPAVRALRAAAAPGEAEPPTSPPAYSLVTSDERAAGAPVTVTPAGGVAPEADVPEPVDPADAGGPAVAVAAPEPSAVQADSAKATTTGATSATEVRRAAGGDGRITGPR